MAESESNDNSQNSIIAAKLKNESIENYHNQDYVWGLDISRFQIELTDEYFQTLKKHGCSFIYIQFGLNNYFGNPEILDYSDIAINFANICERNQIYFGFYFLTDSYSSYQCENEINYITDFLKSVKGYEYYKLPLMLDHESYGNDTIDTVKVRLENLSKMVKDLSNLNIDTIIYLGEDRYNMIKDKLSQDQAYWIPNWISSQTYPGFNPQERTDLIPNFLSESNVFVWQYAPDNLVKDERGIPYCDKIDVAVDRNLMKKSFFEHYIN